jgi:hypothetical protein
MSFQGRALLSCSQLDGALDDAQHGGQLGMRLLRRS